MIIPSNWADDLVNTYYAICVYPHRFARFFSPWRPGKVASIQPAISDRDQFAYIDGTVVFWFDRSLPGSASLRQDERYDRLDRAVRICDTITWPVVRIKKVFNHNGQVYVRTTLQTNQSSRLNPGELRNFPGIDASHVRYFEHRLASYSVQCLKTVCPPDSDCTCRDQFRDKNLVNDIVSATWRV